MSSLAQFQEIVLNHQEISIRKTLTDEISRMGGLLVKILSSVENSGKYSDQPDSENFRLAIEVKKNLANFYQKFRTRISKNQNTQNDAYLIVYYPERPLSAFLFF